jgi:hypothetical protein
MASLMEVLQEAVKTIQLKCNTSIWVMEKLPAKKFHLKIELRQKQET